MNNLLANQPTQEQNEQLQAQVENKQKVMDFEIREYPIQVIVDKFTKSPDGNLDEEPELYVPDYQRDFIWDEKQKSRFIESLIINLPIPYLFVADNKDSGRIEIIDGVQRIRTLVAFVNNEIVISDLKQLPALNGYVFNTLPKPMRLRFMRKTLRMIELSQYMDEEGRRELFSRLNSGGTGLREMEIRYGTQDGNFMKFIVTLTKEPLFIEQCPISEVKLKHRESEELILRFFAYLDNYQNFHKKVDDFLNDYLEVNNALPIEQYDEKRMEFMRMLAFIKKAIPMGFRKRPGDSSVPRIRFEALAIGTALALRENPNLEVPSSERMNNLLNSRELLYHTRSDASNSRPRVKSRLELVRDFLLGKSIEQYSPPRANVSPSKMQLGLDLTDSDL